MGRVPKGRQFRPLFAGVKASALLGQKARYPAYRTPYRQEGYLLVMARWEGKAVA
ncbi:MAG: hypothetical protein GY800_07660 [Planctomycetes bacterium]|nr:hypothetical protein [Planctomycetota bacterium]